MPTETTLVLLKPDAVRRGLVAELIGRFERRGFRIRGLKQLVLERSVAEEHYAEHSERPFFGELVDFITSGPLVALALEGPSAIATVRTMMGATNPLDSAPGTIRGDYALVLSENIVHGSDSPESAARELPLYFGDGELLPAGRVTSRPGVALAAAPRDPHAARPRVPRGRAVVRGGPAAARAARAGRGSTASARRARSPFGAGEIGARRGHDRARRRARCSASPRTRTRPPACSRCWPAASTA